MLLLQEGGRSGELSKQGDKWLVGQQAVERRGRREGRRREEEGRVKCRWQLWWRLEVRQRAGASSWSAKPQLGAVRTVINKAEREPEPGSARRAGPTPVIINTWTLITQPAGLPARGARILTPKLSPRKFNFKSEKNLKTVDAGRTWHQLC